MRQAGILPLGSRFHPWPARIPLMSTSTSAPSSPTLAAPPARQGAAFRVLAAISASHLINDIMQSLILAIYPILKGEFALSFVQIGLITLT